MTPPPPILIDERTAAKLLSVSAATLARLRKKGVVPYKRLGHLVRYDPEALAEWAKTDGMLEGKAAEAPIGVSKGASYA